MRSIADLKCGEVGVVQEICLIDSTKKRIMDMGLTRGASVLVKGKAPFGDPIEIKVRDFSLAIRTADARKIFIRDESSVSKS